MCVEKKPSTKEEPVDYVILERKALINPVLNCLWALILLILKARQGTTHPQRSGP